MVVVKLPSVLSFEWDKGNEQKNWLKHKVAGKEAEEAFADENRMIFEDIKHSQYEKRYVLFGKTEEERTLIIAFTMRYEKLRIISARDMNRKEEMIYEKAISAA